MEIGKKIWAIPEGFIPGYGNGPPPDFISHEAACILNAGEKDAHVEITLYFTDKEPVGPYQVSVPARRTRHFRFNDLKDPEPIPVETNYSSVFVSDQPIVVQFTRLDSRQAKNALITTIAYTQ